MTRRQFGKRLPLAPLLLALAERRAQGSPRLPSRDERGRVGNAAAPEPARSSALPMGELAERIRIAAQRLVLEAPPLEDLEACGRYLGAVSLLPPGGQGPGPLAQEILKLQQADGRFGDTDLETSTGVEASRLQAFLRANGRILVGLLEHAESSPDPAVLGGAVRLGTFARTVILGENADRMAAHLRSMDGGASLTQLAEGLVLLAEASGEQRFLEAGRALRPFFGKGDHQGAADYLASLRGLLALAKATADSPLRRDLEARYRDLIQSPDVTPMGELPQVLGRPGPPDLVAGAELVRASLQVWDATGDAQALEHAERGLFNHLFACQRPDGGLRVPALAPPALLEPRRASEVRELASGYRTFRDVLDHLARHDEQTTFAELPLDADLTAPGFTIAVRHEVDGPGTSRLIFEILDATPQSQGLALRKPSWATVSRVSFGGGRVLPRPGPYVSLQRKWRAGETLEMLLAHVMRLETPDRRSLSSLPAGESTEAALFVGPWLMAAHEAQSPDFFAAPGPAGRTILLPAALPAAGAGEGGLPFTDRARHLQCRYRTEGTEELGLVTLAPLSEATGRAPGRVAAWLGYRPAE